MTVSPVSYSLLREFADFLGNLAYYKRFTRKDSRVEPDRFTREITACAHDHLTPSQRADLKLFVKDTVLYTYPFYAPSVMDRAPDYPAFAAMTNNMDGGEYIRFFLDSNGDEIPGGSDDERMEALEEILGRVDQGEQVLESYREMKRYPIELLSRVRIFFDRIYREYFKPHEKGIEEVLQKKARDHEAIRQKDPAGFEKELVKISLEDFARGELEYRYQVGYMTGNRLEYTPRGSLVLVHYSFQLEQAFDPARLDERMGELFKALSDESRLAIVRALAERPRYAAELADELNLTRGTLSHHMAMLSRFDIFRVELKERKRLYYSLDKERLGRYFDRFMTVL
jgi:DNA-binding transcriptional ArsR family regulator